MAGENVVSIVVKATDDTAGGFDAAKAGADGAAGSMDVYAASVDRADEAQEDFAAKQAGMAEASERLAELQKSGAASADELAAAQQRLTEASLKAADARKTLADAEEDVAAKTKIASDEQEAAGLKSEESGGLMAGAGEKAKLAFLGVAVGAGYAVDQAMKFQEQSTELVTGAGELSKNLGMVKQGMLDISSSTATSLSQVESGMYMIESAGYHGAAGLKVLQAAAEGAKVGGADLGTVANATTTVLTDYKMGADGAASATSGLIATVAAGKTHLSDLSSSLSKVLPTASALKIPFDEVGGAMATMTGQGVSARLAATHLNSTLLAMADPSTKAAAAMQQVGLSSTQVSNTLTHQGLAAALQEVTDAAGKKFPAGSAAYVAAVDTMLGGQAGLSVALQLTGKHLSTLKANTESVARSMKDGSKDVQGWAEVQKDASFKLEKTETSAKNAATAFGDALLPAVEDTLGPISSFADFLAHSTAASTALAVVVGGVLSAYLGSKLVQAFSEVKSAGETVMSTVSGVAKRLGLMTEATEAQTEATEAQTAATEESDAAMDANPVGLIILAITALVVAIVELIKHWHQVEDVAKSVWKAVKDAVADAFNWIKDHWPLLLGILLGPIALAAALIATHWRQILAGARDMYHDVTGFFRDLGHDVMSIVDGLAGDLFNAGAHIIEMLASGIESAIGDVTSAIGHIGGEILDHLPFSPAKKGPLSGAGSPDKSGRKIAMMVASGMGEGTGAVQAAAARMAGAAGISAGAHAAAVATGTAAAGKLELELTGSGDEFLVWLRKAIRVKGGNVQSVLGTGAG